MEEESCIFFHSLNPEQNSAVLIEFCTELNNNPHPRFFHSLNSEQTFAVSLQNSEFCLVRILQPLFIRGK